MAGPLPAPPVEAIEAPTHPRPDAGERRAISACVDQALVLRERVPRPSQPVLSS
jgi:hypothetical protein